MQNEHAWAEETFGDAALGDRRRTRRLVKAAAELCARPAGRVTQVYQARDAHEGAFRLIENDNVDAYEISAATHRATARRCSDKPIVCVAVDQTSLSIVDRAGTKFGRIANTESPGSGIEAMSALAVDEQDGTTLGTLALEYWVRASEHAPDWHNDSRPEEERESYLWKRAINSTLKAMREHAPNCRPWFQMDRGADAGAVLSKAYKEGLLATVRAAHDRALTKAKGEIRLWERMRTERPLGSFSVRVPARGGRPARIAHLSVRAARLSVPASKTGKERRTDWLDMCAVYVTEISVHDEPIEWMLWTTYPIKSFGDACRVVKNYVFRWRIEEFHRAWKSGGCNIESSQLRSVATLQRWEQ
jgi:hypothetical protein